MSRSTYQIQPFFVDLTREEVVSEEERQMAYRVVCHVVPCFHRNVGSTEEQAMMHAYNHQRDVHRSVVALLGKGKACSRCGRLSLTIRST